MASWIATIFLLGFITIWGSVGIAFILRGLWMEFGLGIPAVHMPSLDLARNVYENPKLFGYLELVSRLCARLLS